MLRVGQFELPLEELEKQDFASYLAGAIFGY
jgi:hypothetical protein